MTGNADAIAAAERAGRQFALGRDEYHQAATVGGGEAVAAQACKNGTEQERAQVAAHYRRLQAEAAGGESAPRKP